MRAWPPCGKTQQLPSEMARGPASARRTPHSHSPLSRRIYQPACKPGFVGHRALACTIRDGHSSGTTFARCLEQPTRTAGPTSPAMLSPTANISRCHPYSVLLPVWFAMPSPLPATRCALTAPFHPYLLRGEGGSFSVALSLGSPPPGVIRHRMSMEPGLSSPAAFRLMRERPSGRLTRHAWRLPAAPSSQPDGRF